MNHFFLSALAKALNGYLQLDPESATRLQALQGKVVTIELLPFHFIFQCEFTLTGIQLHADVLLPATTAIKGTPLQMLGAMLAKENRHQFFSDDLVMEGDAEIGLQLVELFDAMQIDWEEYFSRLAGDVPAYHIGQVVRHVKNWLHQTNDSFINNVNEYIHEEKCWLPSRESLQDFFHDIDTIRMDTDRLEAKIKFLNKQIAESEL